MAVTYEPIASQTLGADAASVTFSDLPGTYTDLVVVASVRSSTSGYGLMARFNSDSGTNYSTTYVFGNGSVAGSARVSNTSRAYIENYGVSDGTNFSATRFTVLQYANTNVYKTVLSEAAGMGSGNGVDRSVSLWRSTSAITSLYLELFSGNIKASSTFSVYGIRAA